MTTADDQPQDPETTSSPPPSKKTKKPKSKGFIESTSFKPTWLETGPLSPDMMPPELLDQVIAEAATGDDMSDDLAAKLAELERLYDEASTEGEAEELSAAEPAVTPDPEPPLAAIETAEITDSGSVEQPVAAVEQPLIEAEPLAAELSDVDVAAAPAAPTDDVAAWLAMRQVGEDLDNLDEPMPEPDSEVEAVVHAADTETDSVASLASESDGEPEPEQSEAATTVAAPDPATPTRTVKEEPSRQHPLFDHLARTLLILGLLLLSLAALTYFVNPFARLALATAELARPVESANLPSPARAGSDWCVDGSFLANGAAPLPMADNGRQGDIVADDQVYALEMTTLPVGAHQWQVVGCNATDLSFPAVSSWVQVNEEGQAVTFLFDSEERAEPLFFPIPFVVSAIDDVSRFQVVGTFQDFAANDTTAELQHLGGGVYQHVRRVARPGTYEAYITAAGNPEQAIDAYGRTSEPIPFSFEVSRASDIVVFLLDTNRGRASVLYGMPLVATQLAYGPGFRVLSLLLGLGGLLLLGWMLLRMVMTGNDDNWLEAGCPSCGRHELMRVSRRPTDRLLNFLGIPAYRYQCRHCTWMGTRLSEDGAPVSPGATTIVTDPWR